MNLHDEISKKFSVSSKENLLSDALAAYKKTPQTEKSLREAFINCAAISLHDKSLIVDGKPLLIMILEILTKLCLIVINNKEYNEHFSIYVVMGLVDYIELYTHNVIPAELFKQLPSKGLKFTILAQPKLPADWSSSEINDLIIEISKDITRKEEALLTLARMNLAIRYCKDKQSEKCKEQLFILSQSSKLGSVVKDLIDDYIINECSQADMRTMANIIFRAKEEHSSFYQECVLRAISRFQDAKYQTQNDSDLLTLLLTGDNTDLKQLMTNSISSTPTSETNVEAKKVITIEKPAGLPPPIPPRAKVPALSVEAAKKKTKVGTMSRIAARQMGVALRQRSGYEEKSPLENIPAENKPVENKTVESKSRESKPVEDNRSITEIMNDAFSKRRDRIKADDSDDESDSSWHSDDEIVTSPTSKTAGVRPLPTAPSASTPAAPPALSRSSNSRPSVMSLFAPATDAPAKQPAVSIQPEAIKSPKKEEPQFAKRK